MPFTPETWVNDTTTGPFLEADELNRIETGINDAHEALTAEEAARIAADALKADQTALDAEATARAAADTALDTRLDQLILNVKTDFNAAGDGTADDTAEIQAALDAANTAGGGIVFLPRGTYLVSATLTLKSNTVVQGIGDLSVIKLANAADVSVVTVQTGATDVALRSLKIDGNRANQTTAVHGITSSTLTRLRVEGCTISSARGAGAQLMAAGTLASVLFSRCRVTDCGTYALHFRAADGLTVADCQLESWGQVTAATPGVAFWRGGASSTTPNYRVTFVGNTLKNTVGTQFGIECAGAWDSGVHDSTFTGNVLDGGGLGGNGISGYFFQTTFTGNTHPNGVGTHRSGYEIIGQDYTISGCVVENGTILITTVAGGSPSNISVTGNNVTNSVATGSGIVVGATGAAVTDVALVGNTIKLTNASPQSAIYIGQNAGAVNRLSIIGNRCYGPGSSGNGIRFLAAAGSTDFLVVGNACKGFGTGVVTAANTNHDEATIADNDFRGNTTSISHSATGGTYRFFGNVSADDNERFVSVGGIDTRVVATASLPAAAAAMNGHILIEDNGAGDRNLIIYAGGQRFRIDGGAAV